MKKILVLVCSVFVLTSCLKKEDKKVVEKPVAYASFGDSISADAALSKEDMFAKYAGMKAGDTINVKFASKINDVCQKKGCWMNLGLANDEKVFVKFKDYAFFMPLNSKDANVVVNGKAYVSVESVEDLKHFAKDAGKSQAAIDSIIAPETTYSFMADGVLIKK